MRIERTFKTITGNRASDRFVNSTFIAIGPEDHPLHLLVYRGEAHREFMIGLDFDLKPQAMQVRRERGRMVDKPAEVGRGSDARLAMIPAWESAGWDEWTDIGLQTHELDAVALMEGFLATAAGRAFLLGEEKKEEKLEAVPAQPDRLIEADGWWFRLAVERGRWAVYALGKNREACGEWIGTVDEPTKEAVIEANIRFSEACE